MKKRKRYSFHPACLLFPQLGDAELQELAANIKAKGLLHDIVLYEGQILDGRNRYIACPMAGVEPRFTEWKGKGSPVEWVISENLVRRHLTSSQRAVVALGLLPLLEKEAKERQRLGNRRGKRVSQSWDTHTENGAASKIAARLFSTNSTYVHALKTMESATPELVEEVRSGKLTVPEARELARAPRAIRRKVLGIVGNGGAKRKVSRMIREAVISARKAAARRYASTNGEGDDQGILRGDMKLLRKRLKDESVRMILTDPPYLHPELYGRLAELAAKKLVQGGICLAYAEPGILVEVLDEMRRYLDYWWCFAVPHVDVPRYVNDRHLQNKWKPILAFGRGAVAMPPEWLGDFLEGGGRDKRFHVWGQPESEARYLVTRLTEVGDLVADPFCGGGTVPAVCKMLGRRWLATEIEKETVGIARKRLADLGLKRRAG
jgi:hypothetical protein